MQWPSTPHLSQSKGRSQVWARLSLTLLLGLALDIWMIDDLTHGYTAEDWAEEAMLPPMTVWTVNEGQAQVTREVGPFSKQRCLEEQRRKEKTHKTEWRLGVTRWHVSFFHRAGNKHFHTPPTPLRQIT